MDLSQLGETLRRMKMAMASTETSVPVTKKAGPISFVDAKGLEHKRVSPETVGIKVVANGSNKLYDTTKFPEAVKNALVNFALSTRAKTQIANHGDETGSNILALVDDVYADLMSGKLYSKAEGSGPRGKPFDAELYAEAYRETTKWMVSHKKTRTDKDGNQVPVKPMAEKDYTDLVMWLKTADATSRKKRIDVWAKNGIFRKMFQTLKAKKMTINEDTEVFEDLF